MRIIIADDQPNVRSALRLLLEQDSKTDIGEVVSSEELLAQIEIDSPDIILLDWELPGGGIGLVQALHARFPALSIIVLSSRPEARRLALAAGANAFVCKGDPPEELLKVIHKCGETFILTSSKIAKETIHGLRDY